MSDHKIYRRAIERAAWVAFSLFILVIALPPLFDRVAGGMKVAAVSRMPEHWVSSWMGWEQDKVRWFRAYYADGFHRAMFGSGLK